MNWLTGALKPTVTRLQAAVDRVVAPGDRLERAGRGARARDVASERGNVRHGAAREGAGDLDEVLPRDLALAAHLVDVVDRESQAADGLAEASG